MQPNEIQDLMSCGCYDFLNKKWITSPDIKDKSFNPYKTYFDKNSKIIDKNFPEIREIILKLYEYSFAYLKSNDEKFQKNISKDLLKIIGKAKNLFSRIKAFRKYKSEPKTVEQAKKLRKDENWFEVNSTFKLLDKIGYLPILAITKDIDLEDVNLKPICEEIIKMINDKLSPKTLIDSEDLNETKSMLLTLSMIASMLAIPIILPAKNVQKNLKAVKTQIADKKDFNINNPAVKKAIEKSVTDTNKIGGMNKVNVANAIAQLLWKEGRGESEAGRKAIASVIYNRCNGDPENLIAVISQPKQFSCLNKLAGTWSDEKYQFFTPWKEISGNPKNVKIWDDCNILAVLLIEKKFKPTIGNRNCYLNKATANKTAVNTWGKNCTLKIGAHHFGYLKDYDPKYVKPGTRTSWTKINAQQNNNIVKVKKGDTLYKIAKDNKTTIKEILALNKGIDPNKLKIGQEIRIG